MRNRQRVEMYGDFAQENPEEAARFLAYARHLVDCLDHDEKAGLRGDSVGAARASFAFSCASIEKLRRMKMAPTKEDRRRAAMMSDKALREFVARAEEVQP